MSKPSQASRSIKVGVFVLCGMILMGVAVFMIGDNKSLWDPKVKYQAAFNDVAGLKPGAPVRMGGVDVGVVTDVGHGEKAEDIRIFVTLSVIKREAARIREDSIAKVANKGLLGDKMIEITTGTLGPLREGSVIKTEEPMDISKYVAKFEDIANKAGKAVENIEQGTRPFSDPAFGEDMKAAVHDLRLVLDGLAKNDSMLHRAIMDPHEGEKLDHILSHAETISANAADVSTQLRRGSGLAHAVIYDKDMTNHVAGSLEEVHKDLTAVREGNGLVHALVYGDTDSTHVMSNVNAMSDDLRAIVKDLRAGRGTLGALLVDPSVYEDIKSVVGNVERNQVLRALVRYSIKADEAQPTPRVR